MCVAEAAGYLFEPRSVSMHDRPDDRFVTVLLVCRRHLQDCTAGRYLNGGNASREQHHEPVAMCAVERAFLSQGGEEVVDHLVAVDSIRRLLVGDVNLVTADATNA